MSISMSFLVWAAAGSPQSERVEESEGSCWFCAGTLGRGMSMNKWSGTDFNGWAAARGKSGQASRGDSRSIICEACIYICSRLSPVPGRPPKEGKRYGGNYRNYSHAAELGGSYMTATKADTAALVAWIAEAGQHGVWGVSIARSGQKHVVPTTPLNRPGVLVMAVRFDDQTIRFPKSSLLELVGEMNALRAISGCAGKAIELGDYHSKDLKRAMSEIMIFERARGRLRGGGLFEVAAFLTHRKR